MKTFYDTEKYADAIEQFQTFLNQSEIIIPNKTRFGPFTISTITCVSKIAKEIDIETIFNKVQINSLIVYAKYSSLHKGLLPRSSSPQPIRKNQLFSNQMSFGCSCQQPAHHHKNPISIKVFRNGSIQMTGCKDNQEIKDTYNVLQHYLRDTCGIDVFPFHQKNIDIEMINGTFYVNEHLDLNRVLNIFLKEYSHNEIFIIQNKKSPLNLSIKFLGYFDKKKSKDKIPSVFIYNTGAINIIATKQSILNQTYTFMKQKIDQHWSQVVQKKIKLDHSNIPSTCIRCTYSQ